MKSVTIFIAAVCIAANAFSQTASNKPATAENTWKTIEENNYSLQYPDSWDLDKSGQMGMSFMVLSQQVTPNDGFRENVNLLIQNLTGLNITLDKFVEISQEQIKTMMTNGNLLESKRVKANGKTLHKVIYTGEHGVLKFKFKQFYWVENERAYILTFTCEASQFDLYSETGEKIMNSFRFK